MYFGCQDKGMGRDRIYCEGGGDDNPVKTKKISLIGRVDRKYTKESLYWEGGRNAGKSLVELISVGWRRKSLNRGGWV